MMKKPNCNYCSDKETGFTFLGGKICCGKCLIKFEKRKQEQIQNIMKD